MRLPKTAIHSRAARMCDWRNKKNCLANLRACVNKNVI